MPALLRVKVTDPWVAEGQRTLVGWDYSAPADSAAAAYFNVLFHNILKLTFRDEMLGRPIFDFVAPEFVQDRCTGPLLAAAVAERLDDEALRGCQIAAQDAALDRMGRGGPDPSETAANAVLQLLSERRQAVAKVDIP